MSTFFRGKVSLTKAIYLLLSCYVVSLAFPAIAEARESGRVIGTVYWIGAPKDGLPVVLSGVKVKEGADATDINGHYEINAKPGKYTVTAPGPWASEPSRTLNAEIEAGKTVVVDFWFW
jgi:hypothetical protein